MLISGRTKEKINFGGWVRYEDFVTDPSSVIHHIMQFAELSPSENVEQYLKGLKIYNQNASGKEGGKDNGKYKNEVLQQILNGQYAF